MIEKKTFGNTGYELSSVGLGTVQFGVDYGYTKKKTQEEVDAILTCALENGINVIDTANEYGDSEQKIGHYLENYDHNFIIFTKVKKIPAEIMGNLQLVDRHIRQSIECSLNNLKLNQLDFLLLHQAEENMTGNKEFYSVIREIKREGLIKGFGISVYEPQEVKMVLNYCGGTVDFFQCPYNLFDQRFELLIEELQKRNIGIITRSAFLKGIIPCEIQNLPKELEGIKPYKMHAEEIAKRYGITTDMLALLFVIQNTKISSTILGIDSPEELEANLQNIKYCDEIDFAREILNELSIDDVNLIDPRKWKTF